MYAKAVFDYLILARRVARRRSWYETHEAACPHQCNENKVYQGNGQFDFTRIYPNYGARIFPAAVKLTFYRQHIKVNEYESQGTAMKKIISLLLFASLPAWADDVSGVWKVDGLIADHPITPTCTLKQTDKQISGSCQVADHVQNVEGSVKEKQVTWKYDQEYEGTVYTLTYTGTLDSNTSIKGTVTADPSDTSGDFTAKKQ